MSRIKNFVVEHIATITETMAAGAILGFGAICFALGRLDTK